MQEYTRKSDIKIELVDQEIKNISSLMIELKSDIKTLSDCFGSHKIEAEGRNGQIKILKENIRFQWWFISFLIIAIIGEVLKGLLK